ncbi:MAG: hypothetical protein K2Q26_00650 [Bdellovibrionales bacterium]|nr:hypothetical protein [Bdellovibrionales bacterium]
MDNNKQGPSKDICALKPAPEANAKLRTYKLSGGQTVTIDINQFNELIDVFKTLRKWRDNCNKT